MQNPNMQKPDFLVYSNEGISQMIALLGQIQVSGVQNVKNLSAVLLLLENPKYMLPAEVFKQPEEAVAQPVNEE